MLYTKLGGVRSGDGGLRDNFFVRIIEEVGFAATGVDVGVAAVKG